MDRRSLLIGLGLTGLGAVAAPLIRSDGSTSDQGTAQATKSSDSTAEVYPWGTPVLDMHFHSRETPEADLRHLDGSGETMTVLLTRVPGQVETASETAGKYLGRFFLFTSVDVTRPDAIDILRKTEVAGTRGFGELSGVNVAIDGPEMQRVYKLAAEMQVPVLTHYQDQSYSPDHPLSPAKGFTRPQFARLEAMIKAHPKTIFIGHGPSFWANISADPTTDSYPSGPVKRGGLSDKMLSDYPNLYGGLDATSGINAIHRDIEFAKDFLARHKDKLLFGSDCPCTDGHGAGRNTGGPVVAENSPVSLIKGRCLARVQLAQLKQLTSLDIFRRITWENARKLVRLAV
jgi:predicted TIM-barrel fold metal-dependent hydrolase